MHHAELAVRIQAEIFCIGTEISKLTTHEAEWRKIIKDVRKIYKGALTYAGGPGAGIRNVEVLGCRLTYRFE